MKLCLIVHFDDELSSEERRELILVLHLKVIHLQSIQNSFVVDKVLKVK